MPLIEDTHMSMVIYCGPDYSVTIDSSSRDKLQYASHIVQDDHSFILPVFIPQSPLCPIIDRAVTWSNMTTWPAYSHPIKKQVDTRVGFLWRTNV